jgi:hypothetical protein
VWEADKIPTTKDCIQMWVPSLYLYLPSLLDACVSEIARLAADVSVDEMPRWQITITETEKFGGQSMQTAQSGVPGFSVSNFGSSVVENV